MSSTSKTNFFKEKKILQEEEKSLKKMLDKFQDQLNRLKIEELALVSLLKMTQEKDDSSRFSENATTSRDAQNDGTSRFSQNIFRDMEEEGSLPEVIPVGYMQQRSWNGNTENVFDINKQDLDLKVPHGASASHSHAVHGYGDVIDEFEEEEEDSEIEVIEENESNQLRSFIDGF